MAPQEQTLRLNMRGEKVAQLQQALRLLGFSIPQAEVESQRFGKGTHRAVLAFQEQHGLEPTGEVDARTMARIQEALEEQEAPPRDWVVRGHVLSHELRGLPGFRVTVVDVNVGRLVPLGRGESGEGGAYEIHYSVGRLKKEKPDIQAQVSGEDGGVLAASAVRYNAGPVENDLNIAVPADKLPRPAEYRHLLGELGAQLGIREEQQLKKRLATLKEDDRQQDITYLANKTGWDARMVAMTALASQFGARSGIEPEFYYALFRAGAPANETVLSQMAPETVRQAWERAVEQGILPAGLRNRIPRSLKRFKAYSAGRLLEEPAQVGVSSFRELIANGLEDEERQQRFAQLYYGKRDDLAAFWEAVRAEFPDEVGRLQSDGKLAVLTINNAPLVRRLRAQLDDLGAPLHLVRGGLYRREAWRDLLSDDVPIPNEIPGGELEEKRANYALFMACQLRLSYPTAVVAELVREGVIPVRAGPAVQAAVTEFLDTHQGTFELGLHPVERFLRENDIALEAQVLDQIKKLQRVYQISPSDEAMAALLQHDLDSAYAVTRYDRQRFVQTFAEELGGEALAGLTYAKAQQVHYAVLQVATAYLLERSAPALYAIENPAAGMVAGPDEDGGVLAYPTLEGLFGELDYCACEHCRSWLSPAAYLVDLLLFLDPESHEGANPLEVLLGRRPDIEHLQLTCENTNTVLPTIDLVNEVLEHYVVNGSLDTFAGHDIEAGITTEELLANPQFVQPAAYAALRDKENVFPPPLPFHQPLEALRRYFARFDAPLHGAMECLRPDDALERPGNEADPVYGWRDILMERLRLSRIEYEVLTDSAIELQKLYGENPAEVTSTDQLINDLITITLDGDPPQTRSIGIGNAKLFSRKLGLTYEELIDITRTQFINPHSRLLPMLEKLGVSFKTIQEFLDGELTGAQFAARLPQDLDAAPYGGDVAQWVRDHETEIMGLIVLSDPTASDDLCSFDTVELRYARPDFANNVLEAVEFLKLLRFIRLWRKLGWTIEQTDKAIVALYPDDGGLTLDDRFKIMLLRLAHLHAVMDLLRLDPRRDLLPLLACWSPIDTHGYRSLYRQMFCTPAILALDNIFQEDGYGNYLAERREYQQPGVEPPRIAGHIEALRAAFNLTREEFDLIAGDLGFDGNTVLNLENASAVFRRGFLARRLRLSVREFLALRAISGLDPFLPLDLAQPPDPAEPLGTVRPPALRFVELAQRIKGSPFKVSQLAYHLQHEDWSGSASPSSESILALARTLRGDLQRINSEHVVQDDPTGEATRAKMALVYGSEATDIFFGLLNNTSVFSVSYSHGQPTLEGDILAVTDRIAYDHFKNQLSFLGVMTAAERTALEGAASATVAFKTAVGALFDAGKAAFSALFDRYPELVGLYETSVDCNDPVEEKMSALLADFLPDLREKLKRQQVRQTVSAQVGADLALVTVLLENASLLHAADPPAEPAITEFLALEVQGLSAEIFFADEATGDPDTTDAPTTIDYGEGRAGLPLDPADPAAYISGVWRGFLEAPDNGCYTLHIEADAGAVVSLAVDGEPVALSGGNGVWHSQVTVELQAGRLVELVLVAEKVRDLLVLQWECEGLGRVLVPAAQLYPAVQMAQYEASYLRLLKALALAGALALSSAEVAHFCAHDDYLINGEGWLNALPVEPSPAGTESQMLLGNVLALLQYRDLKEALGVRDERLAALLEDPSAVGEDGQPLLDRLTGWQEADRTALLDHFGLAPEDLAHLESLCRLQRAMALAQKLGIGAGALVANTTNEPAADTVRALQAALRARYDPGAWLSVVRPVNDELRSLQRDALVASVLHHLGQNAATRHIDTPDKLFEYFLIDVQMDPCMKTSRIKQAISSVQLFVQRCLLSLEPAVASSSINAREWEWMKRYRVWEANRKVFLWPENWLEPELRDNKSPFFRDLESELLQGDITDDAAATALVHYLEKLDDVAKLEICGIFYQENELGNEADNVVHVVARTAGASRTYYYHRQDGGMTWTAWEKIGLNIEGDPVLPVVWQGRLFLFWVSVLKQAQTDLSSSSGDAALDLGSVTPSKLRGVAGEPKIRMTATLYWSERYHGKWQPARTSDLDSPLELGEFDAEGQGAFDRSRLEVWSASNFRGELTIGLRYPSGAGDREGCFQLYTTHSLPVSKRDSWTEERWRWFDGPPDPLTVRYGIGLQMVVHSVLARGDLYQVVYPRHPVSNVFRQPFFFQDPRHVFFVKPREIRLPVAASVGVGVFAPLPLVVIEPPVLVEAEIPWVPREVYFPDDRIRPGVVDPNPAESFLREDLYIHRILGTTGTIRFAGRTIGPGGSVQLTGGIV